MRILGLDLGTKTLGVALSDEMGWTAQGIETIKINEAEGDYGLSRLSELIKDYTIDKIVLGFPKNMNGTVGREAKPAKHLRKCLKQRTMFLLCCGTSVLPQWRLKKC
ncbi:Holliday junction resolvase [Bacillus subtilis]|nr:Holliday junction resolvase [Bacillus subtilis]